MRLTDEKMAKIIGNMLKEGRIKKGYSLNDVAERLDTSRQTIFRWESGERAMSAASFISYCKLLEFNFETLTQEIYALYEK